MAETLRHRDARLLASLFLVAQFLDSLTTAVALGTRRFHEGNPQLAGLLASRPMLGYAVKATAALVVALALLGARLPWRLRNGLLALMVIASLIGPAANDLRMLQLLH